MNNIEQSLPLLELFNRLRKAGLPLGIDEYKLALKALQSGFGIADQEALARLCRTLWVKSGEENLLFNYHFQQVMEEWKDQSQTISPVTAPISDSIQKRFLLPTLKLKWSWVIGSALLFLVGIGGWLFTRSPKPCPYFTSTAKDEIRLVDEEFSYTAVACKDRETRGQPEVKVLRKPTWLTKTTNYDGSVTLRGKANSKPWRSIVSVWDLSGNLQFDFELPNSNSKNDFYYGYSTFQVSPDGRQVAAIREYGVINLWDLQTKKLTALKYSGQDIRLLAFSPDGQFLVTATREGLVRLWNLKEKSKKEFQLSSIGYYSSLLFGNKYLILYSWEERAELWDLSGKMIAEAFVIEGRILDISDEWIIYRQSERGKSSTYSTYLRNWNGKQILKLSTKEDGNYPSYSLSSNAQLIAETVNNEVRLRNLSGQQLKVLQHQDRVQSVRFSPNGKLLATVSNDSQLRLWDVADRFGKLLLTRDIPDLKNGNLQFSSDGQKFIINGDSNSYSTILQVKGMDGNTDTQSFNIEVFNPSDSRITTQKLIYLAIAGGVIVFVWIGVYIVFRMRIEKIARDAKEENLEQDDEYQDSLPPSDLQPESEDEVQVGKAILADQIETGEYFPVTRRQMKQSWRYLRRMIREGPPTELDVEATVNQIGQQGILLNLVLRPRRVNRSELLILIDQEGSMVPFHSLSRRLAETALQGGRLSRVGVYHFHNCPNDYLYNDPRHTEAMPIDAILNAYADTAGVIIFSDAGAAHDGFNSERVQLTKEFLSRLKQRVRYIAWLNPMPADRWQGTTAESIARLVPMFEFNRQGLHEAISVLRGKLVTYL